jgi:hypothetical protein
MIHRIRDRATKMQLDEMLLESYIKLAVDIEKGIGLTQLDRQKPREGSLRPIAALAAKLNALKWGQRPQPP